MKTIEPISIWDNGTVQEALVLNTYAINVTLNNSATFWWGLYSSIEGNIGTTLSQGNLTMTGEVYEQWEVDSYAWDWVAEQLNLVITGEYAPPVPPAPPTPPEPIIDTPIAES